MDCIVHGVAKRQTQLRDVHFTSEIEANLLKPKKKSEIKGTLPIKSGKRSDCSLLLLSFLFFSLYNCIYLFTFGCAGSSLLCRLFSSCGKQGPLSGCGAVACFVAKHSL